MASPSGRKEGLRCECGKLLLEKDPGMGLGVRCGRRECDKFHPLEEINRRAAEIEKPKRRERMAYPVDIKTDIGRRQSDIMRAFDLLREYGRVNGVNLEQVRYYFSGDGSDCEIDENKKKSTLLAYYPNGKIARRLGLDRPGLSGEMPLIIELVFRERGIIGRVITLTLKANY